MLCDRLGLPLWGHAMTAQRLSGIVEVDRLLEDGERIELDGPTKTALTAVHTPGHAPGHLCFVDEASGIMIAGDRNWKRCTRPSCRFSCSWKSSYSGRTAFSIEFAFA